MKNAFIRCVSVLMLIALTLSLATSAIAESTPVVVATPAPKPTSVSLDQKGTVRVPIGEKLTLNATLYPENAQSTLKWKSSKKKIASVSKGVVTAKKVGTTTITVTTGNKKKAKVKVRVYDPYKPSSVAFEEQGLQTVMVMNSIQLHANLFPETAKSKLKWKSSKKSVAVVNSQGIVTGIGPGKATITVTTRNKKKAKIKVRVVDDGNQPITTTPDYKYPYVIYACKNSHTIAILARDENGAWTRVIRKFPTGMGRKNITNVGIFFLSKKERWHKWGSGYSPYANRISVGIYLHGPIYKSKNHNTIRPSYYNCIGTDCSSGCLRTTCGCAAWIYYNCPVGTQIIIAQNKRFSAPRPTKLTKKAKRDPTDPGSNFEILVTSFKMEPASLNLVKGATQALRAIEVKPYSNSTGGRFTYVTTNKDVATVSATGVVTAVGPGECSIIVTAADDFKAAVAVPVVVAAASAKEIAAEAIEVADDAVEEQFTFEAESVASEQASAGVVSPAEPVNDVEGVPADAQAAEEAAPEEETPEEETPEEETPEEQAPAEADAAVTEDAGAPAPDTAAPQADADGLTVDSYEAPEAPATLDMTEQDQE